MAISASLSAATIPLCNSSTIYPKPKFSVVTLPSNALKLQSPRLSRSSFTRVFAAPEVLESPETVDDPSVFEVRSSALHGVITVTLKFFSFVWTWGEGVEAPASSKLSVGNDAHKDTNHLKKFLFPGTQMAPKQKIRIKLRSYWVPLIEDSCKQILDAAKTTNAKTMGPVPLPTKKRIYCVLKSPHVHKDARFHFEIRTHQRLIDILYPTAQTIDSLMQLDLPAGVDVEVKL
ncbi:hypothetical protein RJ640_004831 [Escallonia rubra]|uniref:Small ribosomal subunit protein uS10c n=1 Tax=Escallonia rubra TaxID=112253 RepID=A0AA88QQG0_9ASTE|nr:hypothetical protein RJ640_004831 [Escallonia rubra]